MTDFRFGDPFLIFSEQAASLTVELPDATKAGSAIFQFVTTGFTGTLDFQGKPHAEAQWSNLPYGRVSSLDAPSVAQVSLSGSTETRNYAVLAPMAQMRVVMTRSVGSITGHGQYSGAVAPKSTTAAAGDVAAGVADSGNPVKVGGKYNASLPTLTDGQRGDAQLDIRSLLMTAPSMILSAGSNTRALLSTMLNVSVDASSGGSLLATGGALYNGSSYDRIRNNATATGLASGARTASTQTPDQTNYNGKGAQIVLDVTATPNDAQTLQVTVEVKDPVSGKYVQIAAFTALTASALGATPTAETYVYTLYPGAAETIATAKYELQALPVGRTWRVNVLHSAAGSWAYSVGVINLV